MFTILYCGFISKQKICLLFLAKIGVFYLNFYGCLAGFFSAMLAVFMSTLNKPGEGGPKLTQFIKNQAGT